MAPNIFENHEQIEAAVDGYNVAPGAARQRQLLVDLHEAGFAMKGAQPLDDAAYAAAAPHALVLYAGDYDNVYTAWMVPAQAIDATAEADLTALHGASVVFGETCYDAPALWEAWFRFALRTGAKSTDDFETDVEIRADHDLTGTPELPDGELDRWSHFAIDDSGDLKGAAFAARITRIVLIRENT
ncbi:MAG: hypothetical protein K8W52_16770 [Deltaproteobacteria bacterium]|nr:hypothetical protein [Deltaproteobacteria bacterium]